MKLPIKSTLRIAWAILLALASLAPYQTVNAQTPCTFEFGFATLHSQIPDIVGNCTQDAQYDTQTGDGLQATTNGLMVWTKNDNLTTFTDGFQTWLDGPFGLQSRLDVTRLFWEPNPDNFAIIPTPQPGNMCVTAGTTISVISADAGAGNIFTTFGLTNDLNVPCTFFGFVGAQLRDGNDDALPTNVVRNGTQLNNQPGPTLVAVPAGGSAKFIMHWTQVPTGGEISCPAASSVAIILPDQFLPLNVPLTVRACNAGELDVSPVQPLA